MSGTSNFLVIFKIYTLKIYNNLHFSTNFVLNLDNLDLENYLMLRKLILNVLNNKKLDQLDCQFWIQKILLKKKFSKKSF
tara:strand:+ start:2524 stop:2763 length:240 start_codon:yes stop_codon:yes gene_type:complete